MYRETNQSADSKTLDLLLVVGLLLLIFFATAIKNLVVSLPMGGALRYIALGVVIAAIYFIYTRRIVSYRYTLYLEDNKTYPAGSFAVDRMVADKGREALFLAPESLLALVEPGSGTGISFKGEETKRMRYKKLSVSASKTAHILFYQKDSKIYALRFHPSKKLVSLLKSAVENAVRVRSIGEL